MLSRGRLLLASPINALSTSSSMSNHIASAFYRKHQSMYLKEIQIQQMDSWIRDITDRQTYA